MEKNTYLESLKSIFNQQQELILKKKELIKNYIDSNKQFEIGERVGVEFTHNKEEGFAYVEGIKVNSVGDLDYVLLKEKKDKTKSKHNLNYWDVKRIFKI